MELPPDADTCCPSPGSCGFPGAHAALPEFLIAHDSEQDKNVSLILWCVDDFFSYIIPSHP
jgi:hypothetical protein